jgi:O-antigen/teichoic acid export membrane protein
VTPSSEAAATAAASAGSRSVVSTARWILKGTWAVLDQGLFALSNFGINVVLARWLTPQDYGAFTLAYSVFLFLGTFHTALLAEPMVVFGAGKYRDRIPVYLGVLMQGHWLLTSAASLTLAAGGVVLLVIGQHAVGLAMLALAVATPFILLLWLMRRSCYIRVEPHLAASGGLLYMAIVIAGSYVLYRVGRLSAPAAFVLMGSASLASAIWIRSTLPFAFASGGSGPFRRVVANEHWGYGRWAVGTGMLGAIILNLYYVLMPLRHGLESTATLKALTNLVMPAVHTFIALSIVIVPILVRARDTPMFNRLVRRLTLLCAGGALVYWLLLGLLHQQLVRLLYGGLYAADSHLLWILGLLPVACGGTAMVEGALRSLERSDEVFRAYVLAASATCLLGVPFMLMWGTIGAIDGLLISYILALASMSRSLWARTVVRP